MKLSFIGMKKLMAWASNDIKGDLKDLEFEQKDFKGVVVLTTEEAERLVSKAWLDMQGFACDELLRDIEERIEQAEINHAKGDI